jgi:hypothetical protein
MEETRDVYVTGTLSKCPKIIDRSLFSMYNPW